MSSILSEPVKLPSGVVLPNRVAKAAMGEMLGGSEHKPTPELIHVYEQWSRGEWGAILTGNVQVDINHLGSPRDPALNGEYTGKEANPDLVATWSKYAEATQQHGSVGIVQICHPGRQSMRGAGRRGLFASTIAPSPIRMSFGNGLLERFFAWALFPAPREMTQADIDSATRSFVDTARLMADSGFSGIELHGAHGYLIDQFLNPKTNLRTDAYGGSPEKRAKFVLDIIAQTRKAVPSNFAIGIKLNSADHSSTSFEDTMTQIRLIVEAGIDFLEISGGTIEDPKMMGLGSNQPPQSERTAAREAFFIEFATETRKRHPDLVLMLTGGIRSRAGAESAIKQNACDIVGIGRPAAVSPYFSQLLLDESISEKEASITLNKVELPWILKKLPIKVLGAGADSLFYGGQIQRLAKDLKTYLPGMTV